MNSHIRGEDRKQGLLLPPCIDDYVSENNPVRFIDAFVDKLDLEALGFAHASTRNQKTGRPPYSPATLLKLYIYGYLNRIRSSRKLEAETHRNIEVIWLLARLQPDHKTIANFRKLHSKALKNVFQEFHLLCRKLDLFGRLVAIDGSAIKANNNLSNTSTRSHIEEAIAGVDQRIAEYLEQLETTDSDDEGSGGLEDESLAAKIAELEQEKEALNQQIQTLQRDGKNHYPHHDPESRMLKKNGRTLVGYNVQIAVEGKNHLIVAESVTSEPNDMHQLEPMVTKAVEALAPEGDSDDVPALKVPVDKGYENHEQIVKSESLGAEIYIPLNEEPAKKAGLFTYDKFEYDEVADVMKCPAGKTLDRKSDTTGGKVVYRVYYNTRACEGCPLISQCTKGKYRKVRVSVFREVIERVRERVAANPGVYRCRKELAEHPFGSIKQWMHQGDFYCCGKDRVSAEFTLSCLAYNIRRVLNTVPIETLLKA